jgi:predicted Zn-dependent protease
MKTTACVLLAASFLPLQVSSATAAECGQFMSGFSADHFISYRDDSSSDWIELWDQARKLYSLQKYGQAQVQYELLLADKDNIDQARWEYVNVLMCRAQWQMAETELAVLISHDPDRAEYLPAMAEVALGKGDFNTALELYEQLYAEQGKADGSGKDRIRILSGYTKALEGLGKKGRLLPLMEELAMLRPDDSSLQLKMANIAVEIGMPQKALTILRALAGKDHENVEIFQELAGVLALLGNTREAAAYWQQVVGLDAENREANEQLMAYYHKLGNPSMELHHVERLLLSVPDDCSLLEQAGRLNLGLNRPDRALEYYSWLLSLQPDNRLVAQQKDRALRELAAKLLALIENTGSSMLWQDLVQVTDDRIGVYRALADMLRAQGRHCALIQVLEVIHKEVPEDTAIGDELVTLLKEQARGDILASSREGSSIPAAILPQ